MSAIKSNTDFFMRKPAMTAPAIHSHRGSLTTAVQTAVATIDDAEVVLPPAREMSIADAKRLLALLVWCYANELYSSAEIHVRLRRAGTTELWEHSEPGLGDICRFRAENRLALERCLKMALHFLAEQKVAAGVVTKVNQAAIAAEASRRLITSIFIDSIEAPRPSLA